MINDGHCKDCGGILVFDAIEDGRIQRWYCIDCKQIFYRNIFSLEIFRTLAEIKVERY